ncbi:MAG: hypothetical protein V2I56_19420, partial [Desulfobacteraceae bacterium]|nr:hypothetical protein [Desulfobacteraceae bacterium]
NNNLILSPPSFYLVSAGFRVELFSTDPVNDATVPTNNASALHFHLIRTYPANNRFCLHLILRKRPFYGHFKFKQSFFIHFKTPPSIGTKPMEESVSSRWATTDPSIKFSFWVS